MAPDGEDGPTPEVTTADEFADAVADVVRSAVSHGVDVRGSWLVEGVTDGGYDVEVVDEDDDRRRFSFEYHGYAVTVHADGSVSVGE
jgi:hypothetical protein